jgi:predicted  nucleic acid-binding Zn-ribbon protein
MTDTVKGLVSTSKQQLMLQFEERINDAKSKVAEVTGECTQLRRKYDKAIPSLHDRLNEQQRKFDEFMSTLREKVEKQSRQLSLTMETQVTQEVNRRIQPIQSKLTELKTRNDQLALTHDPSNIEQRMNDLLTPIREQLALKHDPDERPVATYEHEFTEELVPAQIQEPAAADPVTLTQELIRSKDYIINEFINITMALISRIMPIDDPFLQNTMFQARYRLDNLDLATITVVRLYMLDQAKQIEQQGEIAIRTHFNTFLVRLDSIIIWYVKAQNWYEMIHIVIIDYISMKTILSFLIPSLH